jgi:hypothetical protein
MLQPAAAAALRGHERAGKDVMADDYGRITGVPQNPDDYSRIMGVDATDEDRGRSYWRAKIKITVAMAVIGCGIILLGLLLQWLGWR